MRLTRLLLLAAGMLLVMRLATASPIGPVWSAFPNFKAPCSGYQLDADYLTGGCITGELRYVTDLGEVRALYIPAVASFDIAIPVAYPEPVTPIYRPEPEVVTPETSAAPEPDGSLLAMLGLAGMAVYRWRNR